MATSKNTEKSTNSFSGLMNLVSSIRLLDELYPNDPNLRTVKKASNSSKDTEYEEYENEDSYEEEIQNSAVSDMQQKKFPQPEQPRKKGFSKLLLIVGIIFFIWIFSRDSSESSKQRSSSTSSNTNTVVTAPQQGNRFEKPPYGNNNTFTVSQLRWILREGIRIDVMRPRIRSKKAEVEFNKMVDIFNSCGAQGHYYERDMKIAKKDVESLRKMIEKDAITLIEYWNTLK